MRAPTWLDVLLVGQLAAFIAIPPEAGRFLFRLAVSLACGVLAFGLWLGIEWGKQRTVKAWRDAQRRLRRVRNL